MIDRDLSRSSARAQFTILMKDDDGGEWHRVQKAVAGDSAALAALFEDHRARLKRMIALRLDRRLRGRIDPSDVIQEALVEAAAGLGKYAERREMPLFLWLRWLAGMKLNELHRKHLGYQMRDAAREISIDRPPFPAATSAALADKLLGRMTSACAAAIRRERKARLMEALDALDPNDREIVALRHFEELSNSEAAQALGLQESAASKRYVRALRRLKEVLGEMPGGGDGSRP